MKTKILGFGAAILLVMSSSGCLLCWSPRKPEAKPHAPTATERHDKRGSKDTSHREGGDRSNRDGKKTETRTQSHDSSKKTPPKKATDAKGKKVQKKVEDKDKKKTKDD